MSPNGSLQTLQSLDQSQLGQSPMLTATTASSATVSSSFQSETDMWGNKISSTRLQGNSVAGQGNNGSGSNLSAYGSDESIPSAPTQGQYQQFNQGPVNAVNMNRQPWSIEINDNQQYQHRVNAPNYAQESGYGDQRPRTTSAGNYPETSNQYLSAGSLSLSAQIAHDQRSNSPYRPSQSNSRVHAGNGHERGESADGLTEMTSALLTMMDRHDSFDQEIKSHASQSLSPGPDHMLSQTPQGSVSNLSYQTRGHYSLSDPTIYNGHTNSPARPRPPPGMTSLQQAAGRSGSYEEHQYSQQIQNNSQPSQGGTYIQPSMSHSWGGENAPRF